MAKEDDKSQNISRPTPHLQCEPCSCVRDSNLCGQTIPTSLGNISNLTLDSKTTENDCTEKMV